MKFKKFNNAEAASKYVAKEIKENVINKKDSILGLATGSTPIITYNYLVKDFLENETDWSKIKTFNLDEYVGITSTDPQSYRVFMNEYLFEKVNIDINNTFFPSKNEDYDKKIENFGGIDLQLLGIGVNGHIGFNEPGSEKNSLTREVDLCEETIQINGDKFFGGDISQVPKKAYSMGLESIMRAKKIILMALGSNKNETVKKLLEVKEFDIDFPASILIKHKDVTIVVDEEAAHGNL